MNNSACGRGRNVELIHDSIARMPGLSTTALKVLQICNTSDASANDLKRVISLDPVLTGRVLKLINSAYYSLGQPVVSLTRAIILLGINTVKNLVLSFAILDNFQIKAHSQLFPAESFWTHCLAVAVASKSLAVIKKISSARLEGYFVAGLLHDLGKLPLNRQFPELSQRARETAAGNQIALYRSEKQLMGIDHCQVGEMIAEKWQLGAPLSDVLGHHHDPDSSSSENYDIVLIVSLADQFANHLKIDDSGDFRPASTLIAYMAEKLAVPREMLYNFHERVLNEIGKARIFLEIAQNG